MNQDNCNTPKNQQKLQQKNSLVMLSGRTSSQQCSTPNSFFNKQTGKFQLLPVLSKQSPTIARFTKVINPFDAALVDRLHLPVISR